jgi:hypothetical protein
MTRISDVELRTNPLEKKVLTAPQRTVYEVAVWFVVILLFPTNVKVYFALERTMKAQWESRGITLLFL